MVQRRPLPHLLYHQSVFRSGMSPKKNKCLGRPLLHNWAEESKKSSGLPAEFSLCNPRPLRIFPSEAWERVVVVMLFFAHVHGLRACRVAEGNSVFEEDYWDGSCTGIGLGTRHAAKSGICKSSWLPFWLYLSLFWRGVWKRQTVLCLAQVEGM